MSGLTTNKMHLPAASLSRVTPNSRIRAAEKGEALPDGSYPIRDSADLRRAIQSFGRAKDKGAVKRHIVRRARALDKIDLLPDSWKETAALEFDRTGGQGVSPVTAAAAESGISEAKLQAVFNRGLTASGSEAVAARRMRAFVDLFNYGPSDTTFEEDADLLPKV